MIDNTTFLLTSSDNGLPLDVYCAMEFSFCNTLQTRLSFLLFPPEDDCSREFGGRIRMATRIPSSSGAALASLLLLLEALAVVADLDDDDIIAKIMIQQADRQVRRRSPVAIQI